MCSVHALLRLSLPLVLAVTSLACDNIVRDWSKCNMPETPCAKGFACVNYLCVPADAGGGDAVAASVDASGREVAGGLEVGGGLDMAGSGEVAGREVAGGDAVDAAADVPVDAPPDATQFDSEPDATVDTRPVDGLGSCGVDQDCPTSAPMCLNFRCAKCAGNNDCAGRSDGGAGAAVCEPTSGKCVACVKSSECTADPTKPVCVANQCAACSAAASECETKNSAAPVCQTTSGKCVGCVATSDCVGDADGGVDGGADGGVVAGFCNTTTNQCVGCLSSRDCSDPSKPICGTTEICVACGSQLAPVDSCATKSSTMPVCKAAAGTCVECGGDSDCKTSTIPACDTANKCVECVQSSHCKNASAPVCDTTAEHCVQCLANSDCSGTTPICTNKQCTKCISDAQCVAKLGANPGVCGLDGSCPGDDAVIYLQNSALCSTTSPGNGTSASPYCSSDDATGALTATKTIIVIRGPLAVGNLTLTFTQKTVLIAGQTLAKVTNPSTGTPPLVNITAGEATLRDLTVSSGYDAGVSVSGGAILHMDRCYVTGNTKNGIITDKSAFDIVNTVIANNGGSNFSGVNLGSYTGTGPTRFAFNTVVNNGLVGVACGQTYTLTGILANGNGTANFTSSTCVTNGTTSISTTPNLGTNYHLTATSPCVNAGGTTCPPDDIDGDTRPIGAACDCGADEYKPN